MAKHNTKYIGLDVHKDTITIAIADQDRNGDVRVYGTINNDMNSLNKIIRKLLSTGTDLQFVYEAGPCGYNIYRYLTGNGFNCIVAAPSLIPKKNGDRIKNDPRDAKDLARLHRSGELTAVRVPEPEDEAVRDLCRARDDVRKSLSKAKQRLKAFLLRHNIVYTGKSKWSKQYFQWLANLQMPHRAQYIALQEYIDAVHESTKRIARITEQLREVAQQWRFADVVAGLQALRGISFLAAVTTVAEVGDLRRFQNPKELMAFLGLVPSQHSSGNKVKHGSITKAGNSHARRILVESAWTYRLPARLTQYLLKRQEGLSKNIREIAWKAQLRLCGRYKKLLAKNKPKQVVVTAIARELVGFIWAIANEVQVPSYKSC